jgi:putative inorganic carbon (HCO3(-)) transporter
MSSQSVVSRKFLPSVGPSRVSPTGTGQVSQPSGAESFSFLICVAYSFLLFSRMVEFIDNTGRMHLSLISGLLCIVALVVTGAIPTMLVSRPGRWISFFSLWLFVGLPFSEWRGGSIAAFQQVWLKSFLSFLIVGGLIFSLKQLRTMSIIFALGTACQVYFAFRSSPHQDEERMAVVYGSLGNANDLASTLLIGAPFLIFLMIDKKVNPLFRLMAAPILVVLLIAVLRTGSRGGIVTIAVLFAFVFFQANAGNKLKLLVLAFGIVVLFVAVVPSDLRNRYMTIFSSAGSTIAATSALESSSARRQLLENAIVLTVHHPVFGVGLGQFSVQSFNLLVSKGMTGMWFTCHDIFALVAAETGVPGLVFFIGIIVTSFRVLNRLGKIQVMSPEQETIQRLAKTFLVSTIAYVSCGVFNTQSYSYQLPVLAALAAALDRVSMPYLAMEVPVATTQVSSFSNRRLSRPTAQTVA